MKIVYDFRLKYLNKDSGIFLLFSTKNHIIKAYNVIIATGGASYKSTGSSGDGFKFAESLGHSINKLTPGGVPLLVEEEWVFDRKDITLERVGMSIEYDGKIKQLGRGNLLLTHFGISAPVILDMSHVIVEIIEIYGDLKLNIDFKPDINQELLETQFMEDFYIYSKKSLKNYLKEHLPQSTIQTHFKDCIP